MKKAVNVLEKALESEKTEFINMCKICELICSIAKYLVPVSLILNPVYRLIADKTDNYEIMFYIMTFVLAITFMIALNFGKSVFHTLKTGETPFRYDIADKINGCAISLTFGGSIAFILQAVTAVSSGFSELEIYNQTNSILVALAVFIGIGLKLVAYILNYGCKLQQESDETL